MFLEVVQGRIRKMPKLDLFGNSLIRPAFLGEGVLALYDRYSLIPNFLCHLVYFFLSVKHSFHSSSFSNAKG